MNLKRIRMALSSLAAAVVFSTFGCSQTRFSQIDSISREAEQSFDRKFATIEKGMTMSEAKKILGREPENIWLPGGHFGGECWVWSDNEIGYCLASTFGSEKIDHIKRYKIEKTTNAR